MSPFSGLAKLFRYPYAMKYIIIRKTKKIGYPKKKFKKIVLLK